MFIQASLPLLHCGPFQSGGQVQWNDPYVYLPLLHCGPFQPGAQVHRNDPYVFVHDPPL
jgi:hypothetical protein